MMTICRYTDDKATVWDAFVKDSKNGTFLFERAFMDYHRDRFADHSLLFYNEKQKLVALLPANESNGELYSHQGLSYGGFLLSTKSTVTEVLALFDTLLIYMRAHGLVALHYKQIPTIYQQCPAEEDEYALWRFGAELEACNISCSLPLQAEMQPTQQYCRRHGRAKAERLGYTMQAGGSLEQFWPIMERNLAQRYHAKPVHTLSEMQLLQQRFPKQVQCYMAYDAAGTPAAGVVLFVSQQTIHVQYGHATEQGRQEGALDLLYLTLIEQFQKDNRYRYFDFGTSNEQGGRYLNESLIAQKEGFGGRGIAYKCYCLRVV